MTYQLFNQVYFGSRWSVFKCQGTITIPASHNKCANLNFRIPLHVDIYRVLKTIIWQESIPVGCVPPSCAERMCFSNIHQMSALVVLKWKKMNRSPVLTTSGAWEGVPCLWRGVRGIPMSHIWKGLPCTLRSNASWVMVTWGPPPTCGHTDRHVWKYYLPATSLAGSKMGTKGNHPRLYESTSKYTVAPYKMAMNKRI